MKMKKRVYLALMMPFLCFVGGAAQEVTEGVPVDENPNLVLWEDSLVDNKPVLNPTKFWDNWFITVNVGTFYNLVDNGGSAKAGKMFQPAAGLSVGKWISPWGGFRLMGMWGRGAGHTNPQYVGDNYYHWNIINGYGDALFNLHNLFGGYKENRKFQLMALAGIGVEHVESFNVKGTNITTEKNNLLGFRTGLLASFRLNKALAFNLEASINMLDDSYDGQVYDNKWDMHLNFLAGLVYRFKNHDGTRQFTYARRNEEKYAILNDEINRLRREVEAMKSAPAVNVVEKVVKSNQTTVLISFDANSTKINRLQEVNVYTAAEAIKKIENGDLYITPASNITDTDLFNGRANAVRDALMNEYNIPAGHIFIEQDRKLVDSFDPSKNCVVVYIVK